MLYNMLSHNLALSQTMLDLQGTKFLHKDNYYKFLLLEPLIDFEIYRLLPKHSISTK